MVYPSLNPEKALIWRIIHRKNLDWILDNGVCCANSNNLSPTYVNIGNTDLIGKRRDRKVLIEPGGTLADYVPFYFTPFSVMMLNIHSGRSVTQRSNDEIIILVSSLRKVKKLEIPFLFTNAHAYPQWTSYFNDLKNLNEVDWDLLQRRDFKRDPDDPQKIERYQAEALIYERLPVSGLIGIICHTDLEKKSIEDRIQKRDLCLSVHTRKDWYFQ